MKLLFTARPSQRGLSVILSCFAVAAAVTASAQQGEMTAKPAQHAQHALYETGQQTPPYPASPLAGGAAAANGGQYMDASGNPIIMPAQYMEACPPGMHPGAGGYGDPMAVDFGGYAQDQVGPHYFDVSAEVVFLQPEEVFEDVDFFTSVGAGLNAPRLLDAGAELDDYEPGWKIAARVDLGALSVFEAAYMGLYDINYHQSVNSTDVAPGGAPFQLFTVFSDFGTGTLVEGFDTGDFHSLDYSSDLQSTELTYRRYWVGHNPRISGTYILGARYLRLTEDFVFSSIADVGGLPETARRYWITENDLVGFQTGGDAWLGLRQGLRIGVESKVGIYNNRFKKGDVGDFPDAGLDDFNVETTGNQVAFAAEGGVHVVADILPSWSLRGGYEVLYLNSLVTAGNNIDVDDITSTALYSQDDALYHGFTGGFEYVW